MSMVNPERFWSPHQKREVLKRIAKNQETDLYTAAGVWNDMLEADPEKLKKLIDKFPQNPN